MSSEKDGLVLALDRQFRGQKWKYKGRRQLIGNNHTPEGESSRTFKKRRLRSVVGDGLKEVEHSIHSYYE
jgi:hypothetical protein